MPYETRNVRERRNWFTLAQAVAYVARVDPLVSSLALSGDLSGDVPSIDDHDAALIQLRSALADGEIQIRWARDIWPESPTFVLGAIFADDSPPASGPFWQMAQIFRSQDYAVLDALPIAGFYLDNGDWVEMPKGRPRRLLLLRSRIVEIWPDKAMAKKKAVAPKERRVAPSDEEVLTAVREIYRTVRPPPNQVKAEQLVRLRCPTAKREQILSILKRAEFHEQRKSPGNQRRPSV